MRTTGALLALWIATMLPGQAATLAPGLYTIAGRTIFVGIEHELPDRPINDFFDPATQRTGQLAESRGVRLRAGISEERRSVHAAGGVLGFSLYYAGQRPRATAILIHGNDPETREMGFIIPFFVLNGVNVISYDQRGTGKSSGNWFLSGPGQRANDIAALYDMVRDDPHVDSKRIGLWAFSNGGWTAPAAALQRPVAFMLLKSAPAESLAQNIDYEVEQQMARHGVSADSAQAVALWHAFEQALDGALPWSVVRQRYDRDAKQPWFKYSLMPDLGISLPPPAAMVAGLWNLVTFDARPALLHVSSTPTLALYGALDRNVDAADSASLLREYLARAGNGDVTIKTYPGAGHQLIVSKSGYNGDYALPERFVPGYPQIVISWLERRGFTR